MSVAADQLAAAWFPLVDHAVQERLYDDDHVRFRVCWAGRRSGKTMRAKRHGVIAALESEWKHPHIDRYTVAYLAPTWTQAKAVYWHDILRLLPKAAVAREYHGELRVKLVSGAEILVAGMNSPSRMEGRPLHAVYWDEASDHVEGAFERHVMPALDTPGEEGYAWIYGIPRPGGGFKEFSEKALDPRIADMAGYTWPSADILTPQQIVDAQARMDPRLFDQEYNATWVNFGGRIYYAFDRTIHAAERLFYDPGEDLHLTFDFNVEPGVAGIIQRQDYRGSIRNVPERFTAKIGEVFIPRDSNTPMVCRKLAQDWGPEGADHQLDVYVWGDATGGARKTSQTEGTDWDLVQQVLGPVFGDRLYMMRAKGNPAVRSRVNAVNSHFTTAAGVHSFLIDPVACPESVRDYEEVVAKEGTNGEIDKDPKRFKNRTHLSDGDGAYVHENHPVDDTPTVVEEAFVG